MVKPMLILFLLGALQGAIGWIMVASGLTGDAVYVKPARLALHFILALGLLCYTFWFAMQLSVQKNQVEKDHTIRKLTLYVLIVLVIQLIYGALMAGHKAATAAPTWPDINGYIMPPQMFDGHNGFLNLIENKFTIHFIHRGLAYLLFILVLLLTIRLFKKTGSRLFRTTRMIPILLVTIQVLLGIATVLFSKGIVPNHWGAFEWMAQLHQLVAMFLLLSLVWILFIQSSRKSFTGS
jgi:cytochrome c oxidase assembly protein subunit 15